MANFLYSLGRSCVRHKLRTILIWLATACVLIGLNNAVGGELTNGFNVPGLDSQKAYDLLVEEFPQQGGISANVVVKAPEGATLSEDTQQNAIQNLSAALLSLSDVESIVPPMFGVTISEDNAIGLFTVQLVSEPLPTYATIERLQEVAVTALAGSDALQIEFGGDLYNVADEPETGVGEAAGLVMAVVILLLAFGSVVAMGLPIGIALFGLAIGIGGIIGLVAIAMEVPEWTPNLASMIGLGVGIDYALFVVTRFREGLADGLTVEDAAGRANATAGLSVIFAGGTVMIAILGLCMAGIPFMTAAAVAVSIVVAILVIASVTLLPAMLGLAGHRVNSKKVRNRSVKETPDASKRRLTGGMAGLKIVFRVSPLSNSMSSITETPGASKRWLAWGNHVSKFAWPYLIGTTVLLIGLTAPVLKLDLGFPDQGNSPKDSTARKAYDLLTEGFGAGFNGPLVIAINTSIVDKAEIPGLAAAITEDSGVAFVQTPQFSSVGEAASIIVIPFTAPQANETVDLLTRIRSQIFPNILTNPQGAHVGGGTASFSDVSDRVAGRTPIFIASVILLSFILLMLVFRSILVPVKAAILNLLSIGAAYGVLVMVFQWGWGLSIIGLSEPVPIVSFIPMFMFAILFGLSMDYEVFLLSRVKEEYLIHKDNTRSVIFGISNTARVITSAALIMIAVFLGFVTNADPILKMLGLGLATAIFVDATIVRVILVPASMKLMGDANWWFPKRLSWLPRLDIEGETGLPERQYELTDTDRDAESGQTAFAVTPARTKTARSGKPS